MKVRTQYIHHSCYTLDIGKFFLVFDYFDGDLNLPDDKDVYFLVSHAHSDHYSKKIFDYKNKVKKYIISDDVSVIDDKTIFVSPNKEIVVDNMKITTYESTDQGVAFMINIFDKNIFFAGDLNDWYWEMEDDEAQRQYMHNGFTKELEKMKNIDIDIAYFLVDPRQQGQYSLGGRQILELKPKIFLPMHFWGDFSITTRFKEEYSKLYKDTKIYDLKNKNDIIDLDI